MYAMNNFYFILFYHIHRFALSLHKNIEGPKHPPDSAALRFDSSPFFTQCLCQLSTTEISVNTSIYSFDSDASALSLDQSQLNWSESTILDGTGVVTSNQAVSKLVPTYHVSNRNPRSNGRKKLTCQGREEAR